MHSTGVLLWPWCGIIVTLATWQRLAEQRLQSITCTPVGSCLTSAIRLPTRSTGRPLCGIAARRLGRRKGMCSWMVLGSTAMILY